MNHIIIAGHLGADPEVRFTSSGKKVTTLRVATRVRKGNADETIWWRVTLWGEQFDNMIAYLKKGSPIIVFGDLQKPEIFTDRDGKPQVSMNITATHLQFSPFGKPDRPQDASAGVPSGIAQETGMNPPAFAGQKENFGSYFSSGSQMGKAPSSASQESHFDDEVPF